MQGCSRQLRDNLGFEYRHTAHVSIILCLPLSGAGLSVAGVQHTLPHMGGTASANAIARRLEHYAGIVVTYADSIRRDIGGRERCTVTVMDDAAKFILARAVPLIKTGHDATNLLRKARDGAGKPCRIFITDCQAVHRARLGRIFGILKVPVVHILYMHIKNRFCNTNMQERLNGALDDSCRVARGIERHQLTDVS